MNGFLGDAGKGPAAPGWRQCCKTSDLGAPAQRIVIADEHANSINDGYFLNNPSKTNSWMDLPASRHNGAGGFSFADGHSEIHKWIEGSTRQTTVPNSPKPYVTIPPGRTADLAWLLQHTVEPERSDVRTNYVKGL